LIIIALNVFLNRTYLGNSIRAVIDDNDAAALMGISVKKTYAIANGHRDGHRAISGILVGTTSTFIPPRTGLPSDCIRRGRHRRNGPVSPAPLVGGVIFRAGPFPGTVLFGITYQMLAGYIILILMLIIMPKGLFSR
jgi:branched-chain amino acid transport system permease protein